MIDSSTHQLSPVISAPFPDESVSISQIPSITTPALQHSFRFSKELQSFLSGKCLLIDEIPFSFQELYLHFQHGYVALQPGVTTQKFKLVCTRCGNDTPRLFATFFCSRCHRNCSYCRKCLMLGRMSECSPLFSWVGPQLNRPKREAVLTWTGELSERQQKASDNVKQAIATQQDILVWAVCGAGKTEVLFSGIAEALRIGKQVALAAPRTDVIRELTPRLQQVFPETQIISLYGGSPDRMKTGQLVITTTHQLLRFYNAFDVIIIDEVDAFPYSFDKSLAFAVQKAQKKNCSTVYLTATPSKQLQQQVKRNELQALTIARRYHGHPLPVPRFQWCGNWKKQIGKGQIPTSVHSWCLQRKKQKKQAFLFVPTIESGEQVVALFKKLGYDTESVSAEDKDRHQKVERFRKGKIQLLVTTTILERGVTVPNIDVCVLGAEDDVFTESALVQIAGRVGRSSSYPTGDVRFFHYGKTNAMVAAKKHIIKMNKTEEKE
ncbi:DEAD/DEAH box helicase [Bacillus alkalicellulosilyticus]|uniref:DEAD/DEAH box helicase n=1 Tax=Alkalihalobacterium alkalicellulosilyticum TaxID=1912214 RepID=UPI000996B025|nr:DEAD/DEAH box helicase [Bacillus alkalicellulosilyticus]